MIGENHQNPDGMFLLDLRLELHLLPKMYKGMEKLEGF
jgi:hypothetical protein